jgi:hypothetical protein
MNEKQVETAYIVYFVGSKKFLTGTSRNRKQGVFRDARLFTKKIHADLSRTEAAAKFTDEAVVIPVEIVLDPKNLFYGILRGAPTVE